MATSAASTSAAGSLLRPFALSHAAPARTGSDSDAVLKRLIAHNAYFDAILSLIPESVWRHRDDSDSDDDGMNVKYKKGSKRVDEKFARKTGKLGSAAADESDEEGAGRSKAAARRVRFNAVPVAAAPALTGGKRPRPADSHDADGSDEDADLAPAGGAGAAAAGGVSFAGTEYIGGSIEVLRARLRAKIEAARATRGARDEASAGGSSVAGAAMDDDADEDEGEGEPSGAAKAKAAKGAKAGKPGKPGKPADKGAKPGKDGKPSKHGKPAAPAAKRPRTEDGKDAGAGAAKPKQQQHSKPQGKPAAAAAAPAPSGGDFSFGGLTLDAGAGASAGAAADGGASASRTVGPDGKPLPQKGNKVKRMTSLLRAAEKSRARIERAAASGDAAAKTEAGFSAAMRRAAGEKVLDNPTLIAASLKRLKKGKAKSAAAWADRKSKEVADTAARQEQRSDNIKNKKIRAQVGALVRKEEERAAAAKEASGGGKDGAAGGGKASGGKPFGGGGKPSGGHGGKHGGGGGGGKPGFSNGGKGGAAPRPGFEGRGVLNSGR